MGRCFVAFALFAALFVAADEPGKEKDPAQDGGRIKGIWAVTSVTNNGLKQPDDPTAGAPMMAFDGKSYVHMEGQRVAEEGDYEVLSDQSPRAIDMVAERGPGAGKRQLGIYRLQGDILTIALSEPGARARPKSFDGRARSREAVIVCKRVR
jgi:uncharacterized protein (TIGR03067 family)